METAPQRFQRILKENNLAVSLEPYSVKRVDDGSLIITAPNLIINFMEAEKEKEKAAAQALQTLGGAIYGTQ